MDMDGLPDTAGVALTECAGHYLGWLKACFGEIVLFSDSAVGEGGTVGWSPREQFMALWDFRRIGEVAGCAFYAMPGTAAGSEAVDLVLDVAFGAERPFHGYTEARLVALPLPQSEEVAEMRRYARLRAAKSATENLTLRLRMSSHD
ncbi:MAG: hypothetical protein HZC23_04810 [Rhodocyclales bacterium]|nr:hypothetical protein [Rhodocyclales bacterium]